MFLTVFAPFYVQELFYKEQQERFALFHEKITLSLTKTSESLEKPMSELTYSQPCFEDGIDFYWICLTVTQ